MILDQIISTKGTFVNVAVDIQLALIEKYLVN